MAGVPDRQLAFGENGTWQKALAAQMGAKVIEIPAENGGAAPVPTGGEFFTIPVQKDTSTLRHLGEDRELPVRDQQHRHAPTTR